LVKVLRESAIAAAAAPKCLENFYFEQWCVALFQEVSRGAR